MQVKRSKKIISKRSTMESKARTKVPFGLLVDPAGRVRRVSGPTSLYPGQKETLQFLQAAFKVGFQPGDR